MKVIYKESIFTKIDLIIYNSQINGKEIKHILLNDEEWEEARQIALRCCIYQSKPYDTIPDDSIRYNNTLLIKESTYAGV